MLKLIMSYKKHTVELNLHHFSSLWTLLPNLHEIDYFFEKI